MFIYSVIVHYSDNMLRSEDVISSLKYWVVTLCVIILISIFKGLGARSFVTWKIDKILFQQTLNVYKYNNI